MLLIWGLEMVRGRYTWSIYKQMGHLDLVAENELHYISLVVELLVNDTLYEYQRETIAYRFHHHANQNAAIAVEWMSCIYRLFAHA